MKRTRFLMCIMYAAFISVAIVSCKGDTEAINPAIDPDEGFEDYNKYKGEWNGNLGFVSVPVTARIKPSEDIENGYEGFFYLTYKWESCCESGESDGPISFLMEDNQITNFRWKDILPGCGGNFVGDGEVLDDGTLVLDITGTDCDGDHVTQITLKPQDD